LGGVAAGSTFATISSSMAASPVQKPGLSPSLSPRSSTLKSQLSTKNPLPDTEFSQASRQDPPSLNEPVTPPPDLGVKRPPSATISSPMLGQENPPERRTNNTNRRNNSNFDWEMLRRLLILGALGILALWLAWLILSALWGVVSRAFGGGDQQPMVQLARPPVPIPEREPVNPLTGNLTPQVAEAVVQKWLDVKEAALGSQHRIEGLREILVDPALDRWVAIAEDIESENSYRNYQHSLEINNVQPDPGDPNQGVVDAQVAEATRFYQDGVQIDSRSETLRVRYQLVREQNQWKIEDWRIVQ
ncbi:MAG: ARC6/PARC6 family protein, partial [Cyanobacteriota bacterium]|nr:ARC6/PARC6 family protein [Cyanobacteriota bacterium]